jgi:MFS family permease
MPNDTVKIYLESHMLILGIGAMFAGPSGDILGRRVTIMIGAFIFCIGGTVQTSAQNIPALYMGRFFAGLGVGFLTMMIPLYQSELAHPEIRGRITALQQFMLGVGALVASWVSWGTFIGYPNTDSKQWRIPLGIQIIPAAILGALILLFPESPRWLIQVRILFLSSCLQYPEFCIF